MVKKIRLKYVALVIASFCIVITYLGGYDLLNSSFQQVITTLLAISLLFIFASTLLETIWKDNLDHKVFWILLQLIFPFFGAVLYIALGSG